ncbi:GAF and ANTAR domain-containing protein [Actinoplanes sp. NPDC049681]|uniref:GAF and ANTAR domain-containing protein n=1 Tax=Actinoplanes sp. NPDC049681 TaxID=3363905 RepID=UPI0037A94BA3
MDDADRRVRVQQLMAEYGPDVDGLCNACLPGLAGIGGGGVTVMTSDMQQVRYASDPVSARVEQLQFLLGEGPCRDAYTGAGPVLAEDLRAPVWRQQWPAFAPAAVLAGAEAVFALPLRVDGSRIGVLDLYRDTAGGLTEQTLTDALIMADAVTELLLAETLTDCDDGSPLLADGRGEHLLQRAAVHQATGMISVQLAVPVEHALARLRAHAFATGRELDEVAADVLARRLRFNDLDDDGTGQVSTGERS